MMLVSLLMPSYSFAQKNNRRKTKKARTEAVSKRKNQESSQMTDKNSYVGKEDNTKYIAVIDDDDSNYIPSEEHNAILDKFLNAYNGNGNTLTADSEIVNYINSLSDRQRKSFKASVLERIAPTLENNQYAASLALINLYQSNASKNNKMMPMLYYIKGNIYTTLRDTIGLKESINSLSQYRETEDYLNSLSQNLNSIRSYKPDLRDLEGYWVSVDLDNLENNGSTKSNNPIIILHNFVIDDSIQCKMMKKSGIAEEISFGSLIEGRSLSRKDWSSQIVTPYAHDSIYIAWCNEKLSNKSAFVASLLRETVSTTASSIVGELNQRHKYSSRTNILGSLGTTIAEIGLNALINNFFTPTKRLFFMDARLKMLNSYVMEGKLVFTNQKIKGDNTGNCAVKELNIRLYKWVDKDIALRDCDAINLNPILHEEIDEKSFKKDKSTNFAKYKLYRNNDMDRRPPVYNFEQIRQIIYQDFCFLTKKGINVKDIFPQNDINVPAMGIECFDVNLALMKKIKRDEGVIVVNGIQEGLKGRKERWIQDRQIFAPAGLYGIKRNDIIIAINGNEVKNAEDVLGSLMQLHPSDTIVVKVLRGNKEKEFSFPLSYYYSDKAQRMNFYGFGYEMTYNNVQGKECVCARIKGVEKDTPAQQAKLKKGDAILSINYQTFNNEDEMLSLLNEQINEPLKLRVLRDKNEMEISIIPITLYTL